MLMTVCVLVTLPLEEEVTTPHSLHVTKHSDVASGEHKLDVLVFLLSCSLRLCGQPNDLHNVDQTLYFLMQALPGQVPGKHEKLNGNKHALVAPPRTNSYSSK